MPPENSPSSQSSELRQIRTFQGDVAEALGRQKESLVSIQRTESLKQRLEPTDIAELERISRRNKNFILFGGGLILLVLAALGGFYTYGEYVRKTAPPVISPPPNSFITPTIAVTIDVTGLNRQNLFQAMNEAVAGATAGELKHVILQSVVGSTTIPIGTSQFLNILESHAPGNLIRAFEPGFMFGSLEGNRFLILKFSSFENAFPGMLAWETQMPRDLGPLFGAAPLLTNIDPQSVFFNDLTVRNQDVRVLETAGSPALLYGFYDNDTLIITENVSALQTIIDRLNREKLSR